MSHKNYQKNEDWFLHYHLTRGDAERLGRELLERFAEEKEGLSLLNACREAIALGYEAYKRMRESVTFEEAVRVSLKERADRRKRTTQELRGICKRLMSGANPLRSQTLRELDADTCRTALAERFRTPRQFTKARRVLHSIFSCGMRHGWCSVNPVQAIQTPTLQEARINAVPWDDLVCLLRTSTQPKHRACMPALGLMLWAGIRPAELTRLSWQDIDWAENIISLKAQHSKTGGSRHISLYPPLRSWLLTFRSTPHTHGAICPSNWQRRWKALRRAAGFHHWQQDILRHTFASYHLKHQHDLARLQEEMGHRSLRLLRTRYLSMQGVTSQHAALFWSPDLPFLTDKR